MANPSMLGDLVSLLVYMLHPTWRPQQISAKPGVKQGATMIA